MAANTIFIDINKWIIDINNSAANVLNAKTGCSLPPWDRVILLLDCCCELVIINCWTKWSFLLTYLHTFCTFSIASAVPHQQPRYLGTGLFICGGILLKLKFLNVWSLSNWSYYRPVLLLRNTVEPLTNDHPHQRPSLSYDHISCDGLCILFVYESLTSDHPSYTTTPMWLWGWSYKRGSTVRHSFTILKIWCRRLI